MRERFLGPRIGILLAVLMAVAVGAAISAGSSLASFRAPIGGSRHTPAPTLTPVSRATPAPSPTPSVKQPGVLGDNARLRAFGGSLVASGNGRLFDSVDEGLTWRPVVLPVGAAGLSVDPANNKRWITGGATVQFSLDRGASWAAPRAQPPGPGPFTPLLISPGEADVWFLTAHGRLLRTRDSGVSWRQLPGITIGDPTQIVRGSAAKAFVLLTGGNLYQLTDNGNQVQQGVAPPSGSAALGAAIGNTDPTPLLVLGTDGTNYLLRGSWSSAGPFSGPMDAVPTGAAWIAAGGAKLGSAAKLAYSADGGATWAMATGLPVDQTAEAVAVLSADGKVVVSYTYGGDIYRSENGGASWTQFSAALRGTVGG